MQVEFNSPETFVIANLFCYILSHFIFLLIYLLQSNYFKVSKMHYKEFEFSFSQSPNRKKETKKEDKKVTTIV